MCDATEAQSKNQSPLKKIIKTKFYNSLLFLYTYIPQRGLLLVTIGETKGKKRSFLN